MACARWNKWDISMRPTRPPKVGEMTQHRDIKDHQILQKKYYSTSQQQKWPTYATTKMTILWGFLKSRNVISIH
jgi:hypothetical protein